MSSLACLSTAMPLDGQYKQAISTFETLPALLYLARALSTFRAYVVEGPQSWLKIRIASGPSWKDPRPCGTRWLLFVSPCLWGSKLRSSDLFQWGRPQCPPFIQPGCSRLALLPQH